jgi:protein TonB
LKSEGKRSRDLDSQRAARRRHLTALGSSIASHVGVLAAIVFLLPSSRPVAFSSYYVLAYFDSPASLSRSSGAPLSSDRASSPSRTPSKPTTIAPVVHRKRKAVARRAEHRDFDEAKHDVAVASDRPASAVDLTSPSLAGEANPSSESPKADPNRAGSSDEGQVASPGAGGQSDFAGSGDGGAHAQYRAEPAPFYPISARRSNEQGEVILRVLVAADGAVKRVEITQSSGFEQLDDSAIETVSHRWRFEPAHRLGAAVESWVIVPIRFRLSAANAS